MIENTKKLEKRQKEYDDWKATLSDKLEGKFKAQNVKIDQVDEHLKILDGKLDQLVNSMTQVATNCATTKDLTAIAAVNTALVAQINSLRDRIEQIEENSSILRPPITPKTPKGLMTRSCSPLVESYKKRQKSTDPVCNTPMS
eukprot:10726422-Ditylum_brightwellii.AAC.1